MFSSETPFMPRRSKPATSDAQVEMFPARLRLVREAPEENVHRYYALEVQPDLFGGASLVRAWGRIGLSRTTRVELHADEGQALDALRDWETAKRKRGYAPDTNHRR
jgi:predicted DNA-binding WGR domain protein